MNIRRQFAPQALALSEIRTGPALWAIARQWGVIVAAFAAEALLLQLTMPHGWRSVWDGSAGALAWVLAAAGSALVFFVIACKQHALGVIMHDATHYRLLRHRTANEWVSNWTCAFPVGMVTNSYRRGHLPHHSFTNGDFDPYWVRLCEDRSYHFPQRRADFARTVLKDLLGLNLRQWWPVLRAWTGWAFVLRDPQGFLTPSDRRQFTAFWGLVGVATAVTGTWAWLAAFWLLPMFTLVLALNRIRIVAEHDLDVREDELLRTRHVDGSWLERLAIAPLSINFHVAHHLFPGVPHYNLPRLHAALLGDADFQARSQRWTRYFAGPRGLVSSQLS